MRTIAVDVMGGDNAPRPEVEGAVAAARSGEVRVVLVGRREVIVGELERLGLDAEGRPLRRGAFDRRIGSVARRIATTPLDAARCWLAERVPAAGRVLAGGARVVGAIGTSDDPLPLSVRHAEQVITMDDSPAVAVRRKRDASMRVAAELVKRGEADGVVSAGNSGAIVGCGLLVIGRIRGIDRPGILTVLPSARGQVAMLDTGANVDCRPAHLLQYAVMGACYAREVQGKPRPTLGVLANGSEHHKGTELTRETDQLLSAVPAEELAFEYVGYVEGSDMFTGKVDVVVCDGFSGNLVLKVTEAAAEAVAGLARRELEGVWWGPATALPLLPLYRKLKRRVDYAEQGGAPLIGVRGTSIICHGRSNAKAICNAILLAARHAGLDLTTSLEQTIADHDTLIRRRAAAHAGSGGNGGERRRDHDETSEDSRNRPGSAPEGAEQRRPGEGRRHQRSVDHRADGYQGASCPR